MTKHWVNDHNWHYIGYKDLPRWVKRRRKALYHNELVGRHFRYRIVWDKPGGKFYYQRRLRYHVPIGARVPHRRRRLSVLKFIAPVLIVAGVVAAFVVWGADAWPSPNDVTVQPDETTLPGLSEENEHNNSQIALQTEQLIYQAVNEVRRAQGLSGLIWDEQLAVLARSHSEDMVINNFCGHERSPGYPDLVGGMGENCYCGISSTSPTYISEYAVEGWLRSPGHRYNIMFPDYYATGVGVVFDGSRCYITQVFLWW